MAKDIESLEVATARLRVFGVECNNNSTQMHDVLAKLQNNMKAVLENEWKGKAGSKFVENYTKTYKSLLKYTQDVDKWGDDIKTIAEKYKQSDIDTANELNRLEAAAPPPAKTKQEYLDRTTTY